MRSLVLGLCLCVSVISRAEPLPFHEVRATEIGPKGPIFASGLTVNHFDFKKLAPSDVDCAAVRHDARCPEGMVLVCSERFRIATCVDRDLYPDPVSGRPAGNMSLARCQSVCAAAGKRIPTNNEWLVACTGTRPDACAAYYQPGVLPPSLHFATVPKHVCNPATKLPGAGPYAHLCLSSPDLLGLMPPVPAACVSEAGVRGCIATLHQWVSHHFVAADLHGGFRFNGGSFAVRSSAVNYVTRAHGNRFSHYANGCRCAADPPELGRASATGDAAPRQP